MRRFSFIFAALAVVAFAGFSEANPVVRGRGLNLNLGLGYAGMAFGLGAGYGVPAQALFAPQMAIQDCVPSAQQYIPQQQFFPQRQFAPAYGMGAAFAPQFAPSYGLGAGFAPVYGVGAGFAPQFGLGGRVVIRQRGVVLGNRGLFSRPRAVVRVRR